MPSQSNSKKRRRWLWLAVPALLVALFFLVNLLLQTFFAHRTPYFKPDYESIDLTPLLAQEELSAEDYETLFLQTGLSRTAVEDLFAEGRERATEILLQTQEGFFACPTPQCIKLLAGRFTCEDRLRDENGAAVSSVPLAPLKYGDIILTFSTHTFGWRHGHAGLVVDPKQRITLEAVVLGSDSAAVYAQHWTTYGNFMVLRVKDVPDETRLNAAEFALAHLDGIPYSLLAGIFGQKAPSPDGRLTAQCAYLPWYAWQAMGIDLDSDSGRIVTVLDLAESPALEVIQVCGIDPRLFS